MVSQKGRKHTERTKEKMRLSSFRKGKPAWNKNKKMSQLFIEKQKNLTGEKRYNYIKDKNRLKKSDRKDLSSAYMNWARSVKNRDNWKCKINNNECEGRLESHHILSWKDYPELRYNLNNGITLCVKHHPRKRSEEKRLSSYFQEIIETSC